MQPNARDLLDAAAVPAGALRILARAKDTEILILHGEERDADLAAGERLAWIDWFPSLAIAEAVAHFCRDLLIAAQMPPGREGWHRFDAVHVKTLVGQARNHLNVTYHPPAPVLATREEPWDREIGQIASRRSRNPCQPRVWTGERIARLGFLAGQGWSAKKIALDPLICSTANNVYRQAHRFGIALSDGPQGQICVRLPTGPLAVYDSGARRAQQSRDMFIRRFLIAKAADPAEILTFA